MPRGLYDVARAHMSGATASTPPAAVRCLSDSPFPFLSQTLGTLASRIVRHSPFLRNPSELESLWDVAFGELQPRSRLVERRRRAPLFAYPVSQRVVRLRAVRPLPVRQEGCALDLLER